MSALARKGLEAYTLFVALNCLPRGVPLAERFAYAFQVLLAQRFLVRQTLRTWTVINVLGLRPTRSIAQVLKNYPSKDGGVKPFGGL